MNITHEMIVANQRKLSLMASLDKMFDARVEQVRLAKDSTPEAVEKARSLKALFMAAAEAQPASLFASCRDINAALAAIKPLVRA